MRPCSISNSYYFMGRILTRPSIILSIAGSDSGGGAGIQADIKAISANGGYAVTVITAITAQNTNGVQNILPLSINLIQDQLISVFEDFAVDSVKIGMLYNIETVEVVAGMLKKYKPKFVVLDPVMFSSSGSILMQQDAISVVVESLFPHCTLVTPNLEEAISIISAIEPKHLFGKENAFKSDNHNFINFVKDGACDINKLGADSVLITGVSHDFLNNQNAETSLKYQSFFDVLLSNNKFSFFKKQKVLSKNTHGTGCSLSSSIATNLAFGESIVDAVDLSQKYVYECILNAKNLNIGSGFGPINHFFSPKSLKVFN